LPNEPNWLPIEAVIDHNQRELAETGENHFVRDIGGLESALARPRNAFAYGEENMVVLAVVLMAGIAWAHAFEQGNKRTAFGAMRLFLRANGYDTAFDDTVSWGNEMIRLVEHHLTEEDFVQLVRPYIVPRD